MDTTIENNSEKEQVPDDQELIEEMPEEETDVTEEDDIEEDDEEDSEMSDDDKKKHMAGYIDYIFNLIYISENMIILNKNDNILNFIKKCQYKYNESQPIELFNPEELINYDKTLKSLANVIFERVPHNENIELDAIPSLPQFKSWLAALTEIDVFTLLYFLDKRGYMNLKDDLHFQYIINVIYTIKVL